jgi:hypothetical protein
MRRGRKVSRRLKLNDSPTENLTGSASRQSYKKHEHFTDQSHIRPDEDISADMDCRSVLGRSSMHPYGIDVDIR